jgi:hypothetical protein
MAFSIYQASVPVYVRQLKGLSAILDKAAAYCSERKIDPGVLLQARLYPDMYPLLRQVQETCNHARRGSARLSGQEPPRNENKESRFEDLKALIEGTLAFVKSVDPGKMDGAEDREITFPAGDRKITLTGADYLEHFSMPNFYFHCTTAYNILRHNGIAIGTDDFMGPS